MKPRMEQRSTLLNVDRLNIYAPLGVRGELAYGDAGSLVFI